MRLVHALPRVDDEASGPSYSAPRLCQALAERGHEVVLLSLAREGARPFATPAHETFAEAPRIGGVGLSEGLRQALARRAASADVVHSHSLWMMPNVYPAWAAARTGALLVVSPRGTLSPVALRRSPRRKSLFWRLLQGPAVRRAALLHATSEQEYRDLRAFNLGQPVAIIPNGVDLPAPAPPRKPGGGRRRLLYLGRLHPIKGLDALLEAWAPLAQRHPEWELRLVGPDEDGYGQLLQRRALALGLARIDFAGPRFGREKDAEYAAADLFVLPSQSENFGMSVAEALAAGLPVVTTTTTPWGALPAAGCGWCVPAAAGPLAEALSQAMALGRDELAVMGARARDWMRRDFGWEPIAGDMEAAYRWLIAGGTAPSCVRLD
ncbi:MAG TPA: glycosyltransferase [Caulobacteraceae bacterium]|jgi:glycosyltransferase involved in cell wall biosynthesis|nr:glycosyltransferase [Caulobacteraceae bacterium]